MVKMDKKEIKKLMQIMSQRLYRPTFWCLKLSENPACTFTEFHALALI